jgi:hypothetical protein
MEAAAQVQTTRSEAGMAAWARRPGDKVCKTVAELVAYTGKLKDASFIREAAVENLSVKAMGDSLAPGHDALVLTHPEHGQATLNNHSFNQFCGLVGARSSEYRKLPSSIAQIPLAWLAENAERKDAKILYRNGGENGRSILEVAALNSPTYGRIWNHELSTAVQEFIDPEVWTVPDTTAIHMKTGFITANDRKVFIFMADEKHAIELPGSDRKAYRGFYAWNSEVGDGTAGIAEFLFFSACANRAIMGLSEFEEMNIRHTSGAPDRWLKNAAPKLKEYCNSSPAGIQQRLLKSVDKTVAKDEKGAAAWLIGKGFTKPAAMETIALARTEESGAVGSASPFSVFNLVMGSTARARRYENNDDRVEAERQAGKLMDAVQ